MEILCKGCGKLKRCPIAHNYEGIAFRMKVGHCPYGGMWSSNNPNRPKIVKTTQRIGQQKQKKGR